MSTWFLATVLLAGAPTEQDPIAPAPPPTPWAQAGARGWRLCQDAERRAAAIRRGAGARGVASQGEPSWSRRARQCPHAVQVLMLAAHHEIVDAAREFTTVDFSDPLASEAMIAQSVEQYANAHRRRVEQVLRWLKSAIAEAARQGHRPPRGAHYYRAYALVALGRIEPARRAIGEAIETGDVQRWRSERMAALIELFAGNISEALQRAERGVYDAPSEDRAISRYIRALVLDRAGASAVAQAELRALEQQGASVARDAMQSVLPIHERLFFRALDSQANDLRSSSLRFWQAYLRRPEPQAPERVLATRHRDGLTPAPAPVVGLSRMHPVGYVFEPGGAYGNL